MKIPTLQAQAESRQMLSTFLGLDCTVRPPEGAFTHMENLTSDDYPLLSPRKQRPVYANALCLGITGADILETSDSGIVYPRLALCYADARTRRLIVGEQTTKVTVDMNSQKWMVSMGAYVLIFPDKKYINTLDLTDYGSIECRKELEEDLTLEPCDRDGDEGTGCIKLVSPGLGTGFAPGDCVTLADFTVAPINGIALIRAVGEDFVVIDGQLQQTVTQPASSANSVTVERTVPDMDFVIECGNRLWGCRYGTDDYGNVINQLYCSKLGDFKNWSVYQGLSTDSWAASVGSDGPFTGAVSYMGNPLFFKENCLHKVYISAAGAHQVVDTVCRGVQLGFGESLAVVGETLYYKATDGIMAYDGAFPRSVSEGLGAFRYGHPPKQPAFMHNGQRILGAGGGTAGKYYLSLADETGACHLLVYDINRGLWHREDSLQLTHVCALGQQLYGVARNGQILLLNSALPADSSITWEAVTGALGLGSPDNKYLTRLVLRLAMDAESAVQVQIAYDESGVWQTLCHLSGGRQGSFPVAVLPRRCDSFRLRLSGNGNVRLYSLTKTVTEGSDTQ